MRSSCLKGFPFFSQRISGLGFPATAHRNFTVLAAGTACSFFSIFSGEVQYGATAGKKKQLQTFASSKYQQEPHTCSAIYIFLWCVEAFKIACSFDMHHIKPPCKQETFFNYASSLICFQPFIDQPLTSTVCFLYLLYVYGKT